MATGEIRRISILDVTDLTMKHENLLVLAIQLSSCHVVPLALNVDKPYWTTGVSSSTSRPGIRVKHNLAICANVQ